MGHAGENIPYSEMLQMYIKDPSKFVLSSQVPPPPSSPQLPASPSHPDPSSLQIIPAITSDPIMQEPTIEQPTTPPEISAPLPLTWPHNSFHINANSVVINYTPHFYYSSPASPEIVDHEVRGMPKFMHQLLSVAEQVSQPEVEEAPKIAEFYPPGDKIEEKFIKDRKVFMWEGHPRGDIYLADKLEEEFTEEEIAEFSRNIVKKHRKGVGDVLKPKYPHLFDPAEMKITINPRRLHPSTLLPHSCFLPNGYRRTIRANYRKTTGGVKVPGVVYSDGHDSQQMSLAFHCLILPLVRIKHIILNNVKHINRKHSKKKFDWKIN